ncbi:hypothetical protein [Corynebacterium sp.]|uniref:hypothetical protein n=1 Tax=Corynebacterium sp. TaxID=1720 RepID=UPI0028AA4BEE|nr:hypothetical protein [Corynebacterium sp.]
MTPETARALEPGTTPGPWEWREHKHTPYKVEGPDRDYQSLGTADSHALHTQDAEDYASWFVGSDEDKALIAAAPDMRAYIASQTWEWRAEIFEDGAWMDVWGEWWDEGETAREDFQFITEHLGRSARLVRRPVGPVEVVE